MQDFFMHTAVGIAIAGAVAIPAFMACFMADTTKGRWMTFFGFYIAIGLLYCLGWGATEWVARHG